MAEFVEVMKKKDVMCNYYSNCTECQLSFNNNFYGLCCSAFIRHNPELAEKIIMEWDKPTDWSKVKVNTPILVKHYEKEDWVKRYFAKYEDNMIFAWVNGTTSWSSENNLVGWRYAKLAEEGDQE